MAEMDKETKQVIDEVFGKMDGNNALGITSTTPEEIKEEKPEIVDEQFPKEEKPKEEKREDKDGQEQIKEDRESEKGKEKTGGQETDVVSDKKAEAEKEKLDDLLEQLKKKSPDFAEICKKKGVKTTEQAFKLYVDQEKEFTKRSASMNNYRKMLEPYIKFDENGNAISYTDLGKKVIGGGKDIPKEEPAKELPDTGVLSAEQAAVLEQLKDKFWELFEKNPIEAITRISLAVSQFGSKGIENNFTKSLTDINEKLAPIFAEREEQKLLALIDEVAQEAVSAGDEKAQDFIDEYADEIEAELKKISSDFRKANPKLAIQQAYLTVKDKKVMEWQNQLRKKQEEEIAKSQAAAETGASGGGGAEPAAEPEVSEMLESLKSKPASAFFGL